MRRRTCLSDRILEQWASWRITDEIYSGTGPSCIVRFREPAGTHSGRSVPLFFGRSSRRFSALNADLHVSLGPRPVNALLLIYGLPGDDWRKLKQLSLASLEFERIRQRARAIALHHASAAKSESDHERPRTARPTRSYRLAAGQAGYSPDH